MVRTKASDQGRKAVAAKAPRKAVGSSTRGSSSTSHTPSKGRKALNPLCDRPIPEWQKDITIFFPQNRKDQENDPPEGDPDDSDMPRMVKPDDDGARSAPSEGSSRIETEENQKARTGND